MTLKELFERNGKLIKTGYNKPFYINNPDKGWYIKSGRTDIFSLKIKNGEQEGVRKYLFSAEDSDCIFGIDFSLKNNSVGIIAVCSPETEIFEFDYCIIQKALSNEKLIFLNELMFIFEKWIFNLSNSIAPHKTPKNYFEIEPNQKYEIEENKIIKPRKKIVWIKIESGNCILAYPEITLALSKKFLPLTNQIALETFDKVSLSTYSSEKIIFNFDLRDALKDYYRILLNFEKLNLIEVKEQDEILLKKRIVQNKNLFNASLKQLAAGFYSDEQTDFSEPQSNDNITTVMKLIGKKIGIEIKDKQLKKNTLKTNDKLIREIAEDSGLKVRRITLKKNWHKNDSGVILGFLEESQTPIAILPISADKYEYINPAGGEHKIINSTSVHNICETAYTFYKTFDERKIGIKDILKFGFSDSKNDIAKLLIIGIISALVPLFFPVAIGWIIDSIIPGAAKMRLLHIILGFTACAFSIALFEITRGYYVLKIQNKADVNIQHAVWERLISLPANFFRKFSIGDLSSRALGINTIKNIMANVGVNTIISSIFSSLNLILLFYYDSRLALYALILIFFGLIVITALSFIILKYQRNIEKVSGSLNGITLQFIAGISKIRIASAEMRIFSIWSTLFSRQQNLKMKSRAWSNVYFVFLTVFSLFCNIALFMAIGIIMMRADKNTQVMPTGDFIAFFTAFTLFMNSSMQLSQLLILLLQIVPLYERLKPILQEMPEKLFRKNDPGELFGNIEITNLSFRYTDDGPLVLKNINIKINAGEFIAFVGHSGSGKSTLLRLLLGFEKPDSGIICFDSQDIAELDIVKLRNQIGVALQNGRIMAGNIFENISGGGIYTLDNAWTAARLAGLEEDIKNLPMGMHTFISEGGGSFSGGQRQRLLIARALIKKPRIVFFDEATSALDNITQSIVTESLQKLDATRIIIAHRLSTIIQADKIFVFDNGEIAEFGNYNELMNINGLFSKFVKRQLI